MGLTYLQYAKLLILWNLRSPNAWNNSWEQLKGRYWIRFIIARKRRYLIFQSRISIRKSLQKVTFRIVICSQYSMTIIFNGKSNLFSSNFSPKITDCDLGTNFNYMSNRCTHREYQEFVTSGYILLNVVDGRFWMTVFLAEFYIFEGIGGINVFHF